MVGTVSTKKKKKTALPTQTFIFYRYMVTGTVKLLLLFLTCVTNKDY